MFHWLRKKDIAFLIPLVNLLFNFNQIKPRPPYHSHAHSTLQTPRFTIKELQDAAPAAPVTSSPFIALVASSSPTLLPTIVSEWTLLAHVVYLADETNPVHRAAHRAALVANQQARRHHDAARPALELAGSGDEDIEAEANGEDLASDDDDDDDDDDEEDGQEVEKKEEEEEEDDEEVEEAEVAKKDESDRGIYTYHV